MAKPSHNRDYLGQYQPLALKAMTYHDILAWQYPLLAFKFNTGYIPSMYRNAFLNAGPVTLLGIETSQFRMFEGLCMSSPVDFEAEIDTKCNDEAPTNDQRTKYIVEIFPASGFDHVVSRVVYPQTPEPSESGD